VSLSEAEGAGLLARRPAEERNTPHSPAPLFRGCICLNPALSLE